jgi:hypothetical protein
MNSASLCGLAGRYDNPLPPRCLAPIDSLKIPAQSARLFLQSSELESPHLLARKRLCPPPPPLAPGGKHSLAGEGCGWVPIRTRRQARWFFTLGMYSMYFVPKSNKQISMARGLKNLPSCTVNDLIQRGCEDEACGSIRGQ